MNPLGILGAVTGVAAVAYTIWAINDANEEMASLRSEIDMLHDRIHKLEKRISEDSEESDKDDDRAELKNDLQLILREEYGDEDDDEPHGLPDPEEEREEDIMAYYENLSDNEDWIVLERFDEDIPETDFQYEANQDLLYRNGTVVNDDYPGLHDLVFDDYFGDPEGSGHIVVTDNADIDKATFTVSILPENEE